MRSRGCAASRPKAKTFEFGIAVGVAVAEFFADPHGVFPGHRELFADAVEPGFPHAEGHLHALHGQDDHPPVVGGHAQVVLGKEALVGNCGEHRLEVHHLAGLRGDADDALVVVEDEVGRGVGVQRADHPAEPLVGGVAGGAHGDAGMGLGELGRHGGEPFGAVVAEVVPDRELRRRLGARHQGSRRQARQHAPPGQR